MISMLFINPLIPDHVIYFILYSVSLIYIGVYLEKNGFITRGQSILNKKYRSTLNMRGRCRLVGAGPGDPSLLTCAAKKALQEADLVIADRLIEKEVLDLIKGKCLLSRKYKGCANKAQEELHQWTLNALRKGLDVVRLKGGDPFMYGRGAEEIKVFQNEGYSVEVIPGISSSLCSSLAAGIALTTRGVADQVLIATGHGMNDTIPREAAPYYEGRTTVYLMSVGCIEKLMNRLMLESNYPKNTPVAVVEKSTTKLQRTVRGSVHTIADICQTKNIQSPATIIIGRAAQALSYSDECTTYNFGEGSVTFKNKHNHVVC